MIRTYLKIAWRNLIQNKAFSTINILGLALGIACSLVIMLWIRDERAVDAFHKNGKQLFQVYERQYYDGKVEASYPTQGLLAQELKKVVPEVQYASSMDYAAAAGAGSTFEATGKIGKMSGSFAGEDFFNMFSYPLLQGTPGSALNSTESIAISRKMAEYFFGSPGEAIGKTILYDNTEGLVVTAVFENVPANSSIQFDFLRSWVAYVEQNDWVNNWGNSSPSTFIQLRADADPEKVETKIRDFIYRYQKKSEAFVIELGLQPYSQRYLHSTFRKGYIDGGRIEYVRLFTGVAIFILLIACINFMNLATARSVKRAKEVGLRKVIGAGRGSLIGQFLGEAMVLVSFSVLISVILVSILLPAFNGLTGKHLSLPIGQPFFWGLLAGLMIITGLVAGSYPAFFLSSLNPIRAFKGSLKFKGGATFFRKSLVVFQFALSIILIVGMIVIYRQIDYVQRKNLGYDRDNLMYIPIEGELIPKYQLFKEEAEKMPGVLSVSKMRNSPTHIEHHTGSISWPGKDPNLSVSFADGVVGYDFVKTMKLQIKEGRDFSKSFGTDSAAFILNETAVSKIGYQDPIGQSVTWGNHPGKIIGVVKDFHFNSMHKTIEPLIFRLDENWSWGTILVRVRADKTSETIAGLEKISQAVNPKFPFTYQFSDEEYAKLYKSEQVISRLSGYFAFLAIFISCLGLFGLATFMSSQRTKEMGIRKVLGASSSVIVRLLSGYFIKLVVIAILIAFPIAWFVMNQWLGNFAYRINVEWWMLGASGLIAIFIALATISFQSIKAALANPIKSLRTE